MPFINEARQTLNSKPRGATEKEPQKKPDRQSPPGLVSETAPPSSVAVQPGVGADSLAVESSPHDFGAFRGAADATPVQMKTDRQVDRGPVHSITPSGFADSHSSLPYMDTLQASFGKHDLSPVQSFSGPAAQQTNQQLGSAAYTQGERISFGNAPDLRTAAHEAAHVVQQRGGAQVSGGVSTIGDSHERHADKVAETVVSGGSAESLLDSVASPGAVAPAHGPVQALHGDIGRTTVNPQISGSEAGKSVQQSVYDQHGGIMTRDANFNNVLKVEFESLLSGRLTGPGAKQIYQGAVNHVSAGIMNYLQIRAATFNTTFRAGLEKLGTNMHDNPIFIGRLSSENLGDSLWVEMMKVLTGQGTIGNQILAHHQFMDQFMDKDWETGKCQQIIAKADGKMKEVAPKAMRDGAKSEVEGGSKVTDLFGEGGSEGEGTYKFGDKKHAKGSKKDKRGRSGPGEEGSRIKSVFEGRPKNNPLATSLTGTQERPDQKNIAGITRKPINIPMDPAMAGQGGSRGVDRLTMDEAQLFIQQARIELDMPLGGSISGTTTDLTAIASMFKCPQPWFYAMAVLGHLGAIGAHTFHEIATAATTAGLPYKAGDYRSFIPPEMMGLVADLFADPRFKGVPGIDATVPAGTVIGNDHKFMRGRPDTPAGTTRG